MKLKPVAKVAGVVLCAFILLAVLGNELAGYELVIVPKDWGFSVRRLEVGTFYRTNGVEESFTNRVSHIGPIFFTQFNR
jgi:hypothetical protein